MKKNNISTAKISDLILDDKNSNKGNEFGSALIEKSLQKFGAGRSILIDKNNRIIAGNKTTENSGAIGIEDVIVIETDGTKLVAVKRTDVDLDSPQGRELALADNATAKANIEWDMEVLEEWEEDDLKEWGVTFYNIEDIDLEQFFEEDTTQAKEETNKITLEYSDEDYDLVVDAFKKHQGSKEQIVFKLLGL